MSNVDQKTKDELCVVVCKESTATIIELPLKGKGDLVPFLKAWWRWWRRPWNCSQCTLQAQDTWEDSTRWHCLLEQDFTIHPVAMQQSPFLFPKHLVVTIADFFFFGDLFDFYFSCTRLAKVNPVLCLGCMNSKYFATSGEFLSLLMCPSPNVCPLNKCRRTEASSWIVIYFFSYQRADNVSAWHRAEPESTGVQDCEINSNRWKAGAVLNIHDFLSCQRCFNSKVQMRFERQWPFHRIHSPMWIHEPSWMEAQINPHCTT